MAQTNDVCNPSSNDAEVVSKKSGATEFVQEDVRNDKKQNETGNLSAHQETGNPLSNRQAPCRFQFTIA